MSINDKIKQILVAKGYSPSHFADEIGVQRSSISHILSGRNRPSFDIIQKIIRRFPDLGFDWILEDEIPSSVFRQAPSQLVRKPETSSPQNHLSDMSDRNNRLYNSRPVRNEIAAEAIPEIEEQPFMQQPTVLSRQVERILVFYTDGTFQEYSPVAK
jgi:transcriptional regulator with XRE-family HTH domain